MSLGYSNNGESSLINVERKFVVLGNKLYVKINKVDILVKKKLFFSLNVVTAYAFQKFYLLRFVNAFRYNRDIEPFAILITEEIIVSARSHICEIGSSLSVTI